MTSAPKLSRARRTRRKQRQAGQRHHRQKQPRAPALRAQFQNSIHVILPSSAWVDDGLSVDSGSFAQALAQRCHFLAGRRHIPCVFDAVEVDLDVGQRPFGAGGSHQPRYI